MSAAAPEERATVSREPAPRTAPRDPLPGPWGTSQLTPAQRAAVIGARAKRRSSRLRRLTAWLS